MVFNDYSLDERMEYVSLNLPYRSHVATVVGYPEENQQGEAVETGQTVDGFYKFKNPETIRSFQIRMGDTLITSDYKITLNTKLRNPEDVRYNDTDSTQNYFKNCASVSAPIYDPNGDVVTTYSRQDCDQTRIATIELKAEPRKTSTYTEAGSGRSVDVGEKGVFTISVVRSLNHATSIPTEYDYYMPNFRMVDLLPQDVILVDNGVKLSREFAQCPGASFEVVPEYYDGRTAIVFTADRLLSNVNTVADLHTVIDMGKMVGVVTNDLYMSFDQENDQNYSYGAPTEGFDIGDGYVYMHDEASLSILRTDYMQARKYIRTVEKNEDETFSPTSVWSPEGVITEPGGYFQYMLRLDNSTEIDREETEIIDVLPYIGDHVIQYNQNDHRIPRNSKFANTLVNVEVMGKYGNDFDVVYTNDPIDYPLEKTEEKGASEHLKALNWTSDISGATAFWMKPKAGNPGVLKARDELLVVVTMKAPTDEKYQGERAYNSYIRHDDTVVKGFLETNLVYNEIATPIGSLILRKKSQIDLPSGDPHYLAGVEFTLFDTETNVIIKTAVTDQDGYARFEDIKIGNYTLVETKPLPNFESLEDIEIKKEDWLRFSDQNYVYEYGTISNKPIFKGRLIIEKVDGTGEFLNGVEFKLTRIRESGDPQFDPIIKRTKRTRIYCLKTCQRANTF